MNRSRRVLSVTIVSLFAAGLCGAAEPKTSPAQSESKAKAPELTSNLVDPINIDLTWKNSQPEVEGHFVEYRSQPDEDYVILGIVPSSENTFRHPDLAPETRFIYRVRPYIGRSAKPVEFTTGKSPENPAEGLQGDNDPVTEKPTDEARAKQKSLRDLATLDAAAPTDLTSSFINPVSVTLRWKDNAHDEAGYLMEISPDPALGWATIALLPENCVSFTLLGLPEATKCFVRVRAFYHGAESNVTEHTTGKEPPGYFEKKLKESEAAEAEFKRLEAEKELAKTKGAAAEAKGKAEAEPQK